MRKSDKEQKALSDLAGNSLADTNLSARYTLQQ